MSLCVDQPASAKGPFPPAGDVDNLMRMRTLAAAAPPPENQGCTAPLRHLAAMAPIGGSSPRNKPKILPSSVRILAGITVQLL
jgi:hypothetical protein